MTPNGQPSFTPATDVDDNAIMTNGWTGGQYSLLRMLLGAAMLLHALPHVTAEQPMQMIGAIIALPASVLLIAGLFDRIAAGVIALVMAAAIGGWWSARTTPVFESTDGVISLGAMVIPIVLLVVHMLTPRAPFLSLAARGRPDPGNSWQMPRWLFALVSIALAAGYLAVGVRLINVDDTWQNGEGLAQLLATTRGEEFARLGTWIVLGLYLGYAPLIFVRAARPWIWLAMFAANLALWLTLRGDAMHGHLPLLLEASLLWHLFTFDPAWIPPKPVRQRPRGADDEEYADLLEKAGPETVFYDGMCGLCHRSVRFALAEDRTGSAFVFSPLQGDAFERTVPAGKRAKLPDSIVVRDVDGQLLVQSDAIVRMLERLGGVWRLKAIALSMLPRFLRDGGYKFIAGLRHRLFKQPKDACPMLPPDLRGRFEM